jgi:chemotaxis protein CheD
MSRVDTLPDTLPGFEHIQRYWDTAQQAMVAKILPGEYYVTTHDEMIFTVLGSCVSACIRDAVFGIGGMNHFMLPVGSNDAIDTWTHGNVSAAASYGNYAMEQLINTILKYGGSRKHLEVKVFGGGHITPWMTDIGQRNIAFVYEYIHTEGLHLVAEDVGDCYPRKILYSPLSGRARLKKLRALRDDTVLQRETRYLGQLGKPVADDVELF